MFFLPPSKGVSPKSQIVPTSSSDVETQAADGGGREKQSNTETVSPAVKKFVFEVVTNFQQSLHNNLTFGFEGLALEVRRQGERIDKLYSMYASAQEEELRTEKRETKEAMLQLEAGRMTLRERVIESISSIAAGTAEIAKNVSDGAAKPVMGFLEKLRSALLAIGGAWLIKNLPDILKQLEDIFKDFEGFKDKMKQELLNQRGWASGVEYFVRRLIRGIKNLAQVGVDAAKYVKNSLGGVSSKVFGAIKKFTQGLFESIFDKIQNLWGHLLKKGKDLIPDKLKNGAKSLVKSVAESPIGKGIGGIINFGKGIAGDVLRGDFGAAANRITQPLKDLGSTIKSKVFNAASKPLTDFKAAKGIETLSDSARESGLAKVLQPITKILGVPADVVKKMAAPILKRIPVVGILVDIALNKAGGLDWINSIVNGIVTGIGGFTGGWAGAKAGGLIGAAAGSAVPGVGTVIGGAVGSVLGGLVGSMFGAQIAESNITPVLRTSLGMDPDVTSPDTGDILSNLNITEEDIKTTQADLNLPNRFEGTESTPDGMTLSEGAMSKVEIDVTELPPKTTKLKADTPTQSKEAASPPALSATDSEMDPYKLVALKEYQLAF